MRPVLRAATAAATAALLALAGCRQAAVEGERHSGQAAEIAERYAVQARAKARRAAEDRRARREEAALKAAEWGKRGYEAYPEANRALAADR